MPLSADTITAAATNQITPTVPSTMSPAVPRATPTPMSRMPGSVKRKPIAPSPNWPITFSPHVFLKRSFERLSASPTPRSSSTRIGTTRKVTRFQARPTSRATIVPMIPNRSSIACRTIVTVAVTIAHGRRRWSRELAISSALRTVLS